MRQALVSESYGRDRIELLEEELRVLRSEIARKNALEERLRQAQKMEALANLAGGIAHDFNNILQAVLGHTQLALMDNAEEDPHHGTFVQIEKIIRKGRELTQQFLTFGRKVHSGLMPLDLNSKIMEIRALLLQTVPKEIQIKALLEKNLKMIRADAGQIEQILMNLGLNARDAMPEGGTLTFKTENVIVGPDDPLLQLGLKQGEYALLCVSDTGMGMSKKTMQHIFEPFFTTKEKGKGTGLGLAMAYAIVRNHDGFIDCSSRFGEGTAFRVYFPAGNHKSYESDDPPEKGKGAMEGGNEIILLVDDEPDILEIGKEILNKMGYTVVTADNGEDALRKYKQAKTAIDLVILDIGMPGMGGIKCLEELLSVNENAKVLISSGYALNGHIRKALDLGARDYLNKPYHVRGLLDKVRRVMDAG